MRKIWFVILGTMIKYPKIQSIYKRDKKTHKFIVGEFSCPEFRYLAGAVWVFTEKVDGTNIRIIWDKQKVEFRGRTNKAQIPKSLLDTLENLFPLDKMQKFESSMCLYGEGYGAGIQKGGGNYSPNTNFVLFDIRIDDWWLKRENVEDIAKVLDVDVVPIFGTGSLQDAINMVQCESLVSAWGNFKPEGFVLKPEFQLFNRKCERIITKVKYKDF